MWTDGWGVSPLKLHCRPHHPCQFQPPGSSCSVGRWCLHSAEKWPSETPVSLLPAPSQTASSPNEAQHQQWSAEESRLGPSPAPVYPSAFALWGSAEPPSSIISKHYVCGCLLCLFRMMDGWCSVSNMQTTPVNQAGIERLPIIWNQTEGDDYLGEGLGSFAAARKWHIDWPSGS